MGESPLTAEEILQAAEHVLRRFGPEKATVVDVARELGVTHGSVYRHFPSKAALRDAVVERWLEAMMPPLEAVASETGPPRARLRRWLDLLVATKRRFAAQDPQLFATYYALATGARDVVRAHVNALTDQAARIIKAGVARGEFHAPAPSAAGRALLHATARFHHPAHMSEWSDPETDTILDEVWRLLMGGLEVRAKSPPKAKRRRAAGLRRNDHR